LFIVGGAFTELERQIRSKKSGGMGFGTQLKEQDDRNYLADVQPEDLIKYGLIPEFVGRFSMITNIDPLSEEQLIRILTEPKNAILKQTKYLFGLDDIEIEFTKDARRAIAQKAKALGTNARGLKNVVDTVVLPYQFDSEEMRRKGVQRLQITKEVVDKGADPVLVFKKANGTSKKQN
jgi:ATP-dependent Clp protease ATP-binding subunit ClpX